MVPATAQVSLPWGSFRGQPRGFGLFVLSRQQSEAAGFGPCSQKDTSQHGDGLGAAQPSHLDQRWKGRNRPKQPDMDQPLPLRQHCSAARLDNIFGAHTWAENT